MWRSIVSGALAAGLTIGAVPACGGGSSEDVTSTGAGGSAGASSDAASEAKVDAGVDASVDAATDRQIDCSNVGCSPPPLCSEGCQAICGCCACAEGSTMGGYMCRGGCYSPQADATATSDWSTFIVQVGYGPCPPQQVCSSSWRVTPDGAIVARKEGVDSTARLAEADRAELDGILRSESFRRGMTDGFDCPTVFDAFTTITLEAPEPRMQIVSGCVAVSGSARQVARAVTLVTKY